MNVSRGTIQMANNRMYLFHRPSDKSVYLGKRMGLGWYNVPHDLSRQLARLYDEVEQMQTAQDDFVLAMEDPGKTSAAEVWYKDTVPTLIKPE